jgi:NADH-quinone oxidoreductase subunit L
MWLPPAFGVHHPPFGDWLEPIWRVGHATLPETSHYLPAEEHDVGAEWVNIIISSVIAMGVSVFAFLIYRKPEGLEKVRKLAFSGEGDEARMKPLYKVLLNKYYVDEIYEKIFIGPVRIASDVLFVVVDVIVIDLLFVNGSAMLVKASSDLGRRLQTGFVRHYLYAFAIGMVVLSALFLLIANQR